MRRRRSTTTARSGSAAPCRSRSCSSSGWSRGASARERLADARTDLERRGLRAFLHATVGDLDLTYHEAARTIGHNVELHADSQALRDFFAMIHRASVDWDGSDPLRSPS